MVKFLAMLASAADKPHPMPAGLNPTTPTSEMALEATSRSLSIYSPSIPSWLLLSIVSTKRLIFKMASGYSYLQ